MLFVVFCKHVYSFKIDGHVELLKAIRSVFHLVNTRMCKYHCSVMWALKKWHIFTVLFFIGRPVSSSTRGMREGIGLGLASRKWIESLDVTLTWKERIKLIDQGLAQQGLGYRNENKVGIGHSLGLSLGHGIQKRNLKALTRGERVVGDPRFCCCTRIVHRLSYFPKLEF